MRRTFVLVGAAMALIAPPAVATAAPAPVCNLLPDAVGDAYLGIPLTGRRVPAVDIRGADIATGRKTLVAVLRLGSTATADEPALALGAKWGFGTTLWGRSISFRRTMEPTAEGPRYTNRATVTVGGVTTEIPGLTVVVDDTSIRWIVPRANVAALGKKNGTFTSFFASSSASFASYDMAPDDGRGSTATYRDMRPSCVRPA